MRLIVLLTLLLLNVAQKHGFSQIESSYNEDLDVRIYECIIDTLNNLYNFDFHTPDLVHANSNLYGQSPFDTITLLNHDTYEETKRLAIDHKIQLDSINYHEAQLFKKRLEYPDGIYTLSALSENVIHSSINLNDFIELDNYPDPNKLSGIDSGFIKRSNLGKFNIIEYSSESLNLYKYVIKAQISLSNIVWNASQDICLIECYFLHNWQKTGVSGGGVQFIIKKTDNDLEILKIIGLSEI